MNRLQTGDRLAQKPRAGSGQRSGAGPRHWPLPLYSRLLGSSADVPPILAKKNAHFAWSNFRLSSAVCGLPLAPLRTPDNSPLTANPLHSPRGCMASLWLLNFSLSGALVPFPASHTRVLQSEITLRCGYSCGHYTAPTPCIYPNGIHNKRILSRVEF